MCILFIDHLYFVDVRNCVYIRFCIEYIFDIFASLVLKTGRSNSNEKHRYVPTRIRMILFIILFYRVKRVIAINGKYSYGRPGRLLF